MVQSVWLLIKKSLSITQSEYIFGLDPAPPIQINHIIQLSQYEQIHEERCMEEWDQTVVLMSGCLLWCLCLNLDSPSYAQWRMSDAFTSSVISLIKGRLRRGRQNGKLKRLIK